MNVAEICEDLKIYNGRAWRYSECLRSFFFLGLVVNKSKNKKFMARIEISHIARRCNFTLAWVIFLTIVHVRDCLGKNLFSLAKNKESLSQHGHRILRKTSDTYYNERWELPNVSRFLETVRSSVCRKWWRSTDSKISLSEWCKIVQ